MKSLTIYLLIPGVAIMLAATGCKTPVGAKRIHGERNKITDNNSDLPKESTSTEREPTPIPPFDLPKSTQDPVTLADQAVYFGYDSSAIKGGEKNKISVVANYLKSHPENQVLIEGNCDERGTEEYNRALGERRGLAAREALLAAGIGPERIDLISYGEDKPAEAGHDEVAWQKNRRAAFVLLSGPK